jgi:hypothetical protein
LGGPAGNESMDSAVPAGAPAKGEKLEQTMDQIREKYGSSSITYGAIIGNDIGIEMDMDELKEDE